MPWACGCLGAYLANEQAGRVVIQKVETTSSDSADSSGTSAVDVVAAISPTVVSITTEKMEVSQFWFGTQISSGVIVSEDGYTLACAHVISGADNILVTTSDGMEYTAEVVGSYEDGDIAVLKIEAEGLQAAVLGDSDTVQTGETVYAAGNPGGTLSGTVTDGIISATDRTISVSSRVRVAAVPTPSAPSGPFLWRSFRPARRPAPATPAAACSTARENSSASSTPRVPERARRVWASPSPPTLPRRSPLPSSMTVFLSLQTQRPTKTVRY